jgi:septal ring factor EnvC (AmiA/AmiB activator)
VTEAVVDLPELPHDWFGLAAWALIAIALVAPTVLWVRHEHKSTKSEIQGVAKGVAAVAHSVNNRPDTTRDQLDRIEQNQARIEKRQDELADDMRGVKKDVGRIGDALNDDRDANRTDIARIDRRIDNLEARK